MRDDCNLRADCAAQAQLVQVDGLDGTALLGADFVLFFGFISSEILNILLGKALWPFTGAGEGVMAYLWRPARRIDYTYLKAAAHTLFLHGIIILCCS